MNSPESDPIRIVVMGVSGSGKTTIGLRLAGRLDVRFVDADSVHPPENVAKMSAGIPLTDADRLPWLEALRDELARSRSIVITCSALARGYRDVLRQAGEVAFVYLDVDRDTVRERVAGRTGHFMRPGMVTSQFSALEGPEDDERDVLTLDGTQPVSDLVDTLVDHFDRG